MFSMSAACRIRSTFRSLSTRPGLKMSFPQSQELRDKLFDLISFLIPHYVTEGKSRLVIAFGCTGGKHRSVTFAELTAAYLREKGLRVRTLHRDAEKK